MNNTLRLYLDVFYTTYINDILVYSNNLAEYRKYVDLILEDKYEFYKTEVLYLRLIILIDGV